MFEQERTAWSDARAWLSTTGSGMVEQERTTGDDRPRMVEQARTTGSDAATPLSRSGVERRPRVVEHDGERHG